jgi:hypothetical protein
MNVMEKQNEELHNTMNSSPDELEQLIATGQWKEHSKVIDSDQILRMAEIIKEQSIDISIKRSGTGMTVIFKG